MEVCCLGRRRVCYRRHNWRIYVTEILKCDSRGRGKSREVAGYSTAAVLVPGRHPRPSPTADCFSPAAYVCSLC
jgi:hypothetical protein